MSTPIVEYLLNEPTQLLTGSVMALIGSKVYKNFYETTKTGFKVNGKYQTKENALIQFLFSLSVMGIVSLVIKYAIEYIVAYYAIEPIGVFGLDIIVAMLAINVIIPYWKFSDPSSVTVYCVGAGILTLSKLGYI